MFAVPFPFGRVLLIEDRMAFSKAQTAAVTVAAVLLAGGGTYVIQHQKEPAPPTATATTAPVTSDNESLIRDIIAQMNSRALENAPPFLFVGPSLSDRGPGVISMNRKFMGKGVTLRELLATAYGTSRTRVRTPGVELPPDRFDYLVSLATGQQEALQQLLRDRFGLTAGQATQEEDVYVLTMRAGEPERLKPAEGSERGSRVMNHDNSIQLQNASISTLARNLEQMAGMPVVDETGLRGRFDILLTWEPPPDNGATERNSRPSFEMLTKSLTDQLGLELRRDRRDLDVLLVKKTKPAN